MTDDNDRTADMEQTAGELAAALARADGKHTALPPLLASRIIADGEHQVAGGQQVGMGSGSTGATVIPIRRDSQWLAHFGWLTAAAAIIAWIFVPSPVERRPRPPGTVAIQALRDSLLTDASAMRIAWAPSTDPAATGATGDVVWSARTQRGVLHFRDLAPNDPRLAQYQLWIIDAERDARYPVDGGVFNVTHAGDVLIPIAARLPVSRPTLFAVTLERPGGVVVSNRERLVLAGVVGG